MWSTLSQIALVAVVAPVAQALLRFPCAQHTVTRADPLVSPGKVSSHSHQIVGGNAFDFEMAQGLDLGSKATCSTCQVKENKSNYWTADLYFQSPTNGTFKRVQRKTGLYLGNPTNGGIVVYYTQKPGQTTAFPKGFRMIAGDAMARSYNQSYDDQRSILFRCLTTDHTSGPDTNGMPTTKCAGGVRTQINFPTCWDGQNLDSTNHHSHVAYATGSSFYNYGSGCPSSHPVQTPLLFLETYWDTTAFDAYWTPGNGKQPFVWANGDPTGYGYHADYMMGWEGNSLVDAMARCTDQSGQISACPVLTTRSEQDMNDCVVPNRVDEELDDWLPSLPGCNPIQAGPGRATTPASCDAPTEILPKSAVTFLKSDIPGWTPVGCGAEGTNENILGGARTTMASMTIEKCVNYCNGQGQKYAGVKNQNTCSCGNTVNTSKFSPNYACDWQCPGDLNEYCGSATRIAVYSGSGPVSLPPVPSATTTNGGSVPSQPPAGGGGTIAKFGQCGGDGWSGSGTCVDGCSCKYSNQWYSQCL